MTTYTYEETLYSDFHKDVYGFRPGNSDSFYTASPDIKQVIWDQLGELFERNQRDEEQKNAEAIENFKKYLSRFDSYADAISDIVKFNDFESTLDVEDYVWNQGILFTDIGRNILNELTHEFEHQECVV